MSNVDRITAGDRVLVEDVDPITGKVRIKQGYADLVYRGSHTIETRGQDGKLVQEKNTSLKAPANRLGIVVSVESDVFAGESKFFDNQVPDYSPKSISRLRKDVLSIRLHQ